MNYDGYSGTAIITFNAEIKVKFTSQNLEIKIVVVSVLSIY